jgi:hypothetical protein
MDGKGIFLWHRIGLANLHLAVHPKLLICESVAIDQNNFRQNQIEITTFLP